MADSSFLDTNEIEPYLSQFGVIGTDETMNSDNMIFILYNAIINRFQVEMTPIEYDLFSQYQCRVYDLVQNMRELSVRDINVILNYLLKDHSELVDIIIMTWCLPRHTISSKIIYKNHYIANIQKYNHKLLALIDSEFMKGFSIDSLSACVNLPIHCIDYIWHYLSQCKLRFKYCNRESGNFFKIDAKDDDDFDIEDPSHINYHHDHHVSENDVFLSIGDTDTDTESTINVYLSISLITIFEYKLGLVHTNKQPLQTCLRGFMTDTKSSNILSRNDNYRTHRSEITSDPIKYLNVKSSN